VCDALTAAYKAQVLTCPTDEAGWLQIAAEFERKWQVPHAIGALDGKHVAIRKPADSGSLYHNYKGFFSIVLMGLVDADYKFIWADVGGLGHQSDAQIYNDSELKDCLDNGHLHLPAPAPLPHDDQDMPYFFLGDDAFALRTSFTKPYPDRAHSRSHRLYNYRISRGRRVVENAFGILASRWRCLLTTLQQSPVVVIKMVNAMLCLHNFFRMNFPAEGNRLIDRDNDNHQIVPGAWRLNANMHEVYRAVGGNYDKTTAKRQRETLRLYFTSTVGTVPWQDNMVAGGPPQ